MRNLKLNVEFDIAVTLCYESMYFSEMRDDECGEIQESIDTERCLRRSGLMYNMIHDDDSKDTIKQYIMDHLSDPEFNKYIDIRITSAEDVDDEEIKQFCKENEE